MSTLKRVWTESVAACGPGGVAVAALAGLRRRTGERPRCPAGTPSLDYVAQGHGRRDVRLADFKGRPLLINFWATWCPPCKAEIPWFVEFAEKYKDKNLAVLGISVDDSPEDIRKFAAEHKVNYPMLVGNRSR